MSTLEKIKTNKTVIEKRLGHTFREEDLLFMAFVHRSFVNENKHLNIENNERLEFLGDSVLGLLVSDYLYRYLPLQPEGELSQIRSRIVEANSCMRYMQQIDVAEFLLMGKGERLNHGRGRESILANLFEALIGAIYLDGGLQPTKKFFFKNFSPIIENILSTPEQNWKALLQDYAQKKFQQPPIYTVVDETGPDHKKHFVIEVSICNTVIGKGQGGSKKEAQQSAAQIAMKEITKQQ